MLTTISQPFVTSKSSLSILFIFPKENSFVTINVSRTLPNAKHA